MKIALVCNALLPAAAYGGTERVVWDLANALSRKGHRVVLVAARGTRALFAEVVEYDFQSPLKDALPEGVDVIHYNNSLPPGMPEMPYIITYHGNFSSGEILDSNGVFVSSDHARRHGSREFVYNGLDWDRFPKADITGFRDRLHFLGKGAWKVKNMKGAIKTAHKAGMPIDIMGADRVSLKMGIKISLDLNARFHGMVTDEGKARLIPSSRGLVFPVKWPEPFGLAITESLWYGAPLYGTPRGSLPELVGECGFLSESYDELAAAIREGVGFNPEKCRQYAADIFNADKMAEGYLEKYERVVNGHTLNPTPPTGQLNS